MNFVFEIFEYSIYVYYIIYCIIIYIAAVFCFNMPFFRIDNINY